MSLSGMTITLTKTYQGQINGSTQHSSGSPIVCFCFSFFPCILNPSEVSLIIGGRGTHSIGPVVQNCNSFLLGCSIRQRPPGTVSSSSRMEGCLTLGAAQRAAASWTCVADHHGIQVSLILERRRVPIRRHSIPQIAVHA
jgi:hypothetical protein